MRIVFDTRLANLAFVAPPKTRLASEAALGASEFECPDFYVASGDTNNALYCIGFPPGLDKHAILSSVRAGDVGISDLDGDEVGANACISPCLSFLPMGWTWALHICQCVMASVLGSCGFTGDACIVDGEPGRVVSAN